MVVFIVLLIRFASIGNEMSVSLKRNKRMRKLSVEIGPPATSQSPIIKTTNRKQLRSTFPCSVIKNNDEGGKKYSHGQEHVIQSLSQKNRFDFLDFPFQFGGYQKEGIFVVLLF